MKKFAGLMLVALLAAGCNVVDTMKEGFRHSQDVADDLEKAVGVKPFVGFNWANGTLTNVSVTFEGVPSGRSTEEIVSLSRRAIGTHFKQQPKQIVISYAVPGEGS